TTLTCTTLSTTSQSCNIIKGTGIFTITSTSSSPRIYQDPLISNPYSSIYKSSSTTTTTTATSSSESSSLDFKEANSGIKSLSPIFFSSTTLLLLLLVIF
ncbi:hypothetical protein CYY_010528, partial [Polysphondylium violaceum]